MPCHLRLEPRHVVHHCDVLGRDVLHRLDAGDEIGDAVRSEHHAERRLIVARRVDDTQALHERALRRLQVCARRAQPDLVDRKVVIDRMQLLRRGDQARACTLQARVEPVDLGEDGLRLCALLVDRGVAGGHACRDTCRSESDDQHQRLSLMKLNNGLPPLLPTGAPEGAGTSQVQEASRGSGHLQTNKRHKPPAFSGSNLS